MLARPKSDEYVEYYGLYVKRVDGDDAIGTMATNLDSTLTLLGSVDEERANHRYAPGKWSVKQVVGHMTDVERVFGVRALAFARCDQAARPGFEQDDYVANANFDKRTLADVVDEFKHVRMSTLAMFRSFDDEMWSRRGVASGFEFTVRSFPFIIAGHEIHHVGVLKERYL